LSRELLIRDQRAQHSVPSHGVLTALRVVRPHGGSSGMDAAMSPFVSINAEEKNIPIRSSDLEMQNVWIFLELQVNSECLTYLVRSSECQHVWIFVWHTFLYALFLRNTYLLLLFRKCRRGEPNQHCYTDSQLMGAFDTIRADGWGWCSTFTIKNSREQCTDRPMASFVSVPHRMSADQSAKVRTNSVQINKKVPCHTLTTNWRNIKTSAVEMV
jgi:hypothetical protein